MKIFAQGVIIYYASLFLFFIYARAISFKQRRICYELLDSCFLKFIFTFMLLGP
jgi:hypothetical protein